MYSYDIFFYGSITFGIGVVLASIGVNTLGCFVGFLAILGASLLGWLFFEERKFLWIGCISFGLVLGGAYYHIDDARFREYPIPSGRQVTLEGVIVSNPETEGGYTNFLVSVQKIGRLKLTTPAYPTFEYGDEILFSGKIKEIDPLYRRALEKDRIRGTVGFPKIEVLDSSKGSAMYRFLYRVRNSMVEGMYRVFPAREAALASGLVVGDTSGFSDSFKSDMKASGTTHLTALSGYNIMVVVSIIGTIFSFFLRRMGTFFATVIFVIGFVLATGGEASAVRAAIMASVLLVGGQVGRVYSARNAIALAGLLMVLVNPKVLVFDLGFQLSFLALIGITYLAPAMLAFLKVKTGRDETLSFGGVFLATIAAQLMVLPVVSMWIGSFPLFSVVPNILIAPLVPISMTVSFISSILTQVFGYAGIVFGWLGYPVLRGIVWIIETSARYSINVSYVAAFPVVAAYYVFIALGIRVGMKRARDVKPNG